MNKNKSKAMAKNSVMNLFKIVASLRVKRPQDPTRISWTMEGLIRDLNSVRLKEGTIVQILYIYMAYTNNGVARLLAKYFGSDVARFFLQWRSKVLWQWRSEVI